MKRGASQRPLTIAIAPLTAGDAPLTQHVGSLLTKSSLYTYAHRQKTAYHRARTAAGRKGAAHPCAVIAFADRTGATRFSHTPVMLPASAIV